MRTTKQQAFTKKDIYESVTNQVITAMEKGNIIWQQGWHQMGAPKNIVTGKIYKGFNRMWLNFIINYCNFSNPNFITYKQAQTLGGNIKKGSKGTNIIFYDIVMDKNATTATIGGNSFEGDTQNIKYILKSHTVFNLDQTEGIKIPEIKKTELLRELNVIEECATIIENMPNRPAFLHKGDQPYYNPTQDKIVMPEQRLFHTDEEYYTTFFHELAHSTGHAKRLNRKGITESVEFGSEKYSKEELIAEFTASFLSGVAGIEKPTIENSAAYIQNWMTTLKNDKRMIVQAATQAQKAADYILGVL